MRELRELRLPEEPPVDATVEIRGGHLSSTYYDGGPWQRTSGGDIAGTGGMWWREDENGMEIVSWVGLVRRWLEVHPYERARLVVVDEGPDAETCPHCSYALIVHTDRDRRECLRELASQARKAAAGGVR